MFSIPRTPRGLIEYALRALGKRSVLVNDLVFFLSFDLRQMTPSQAQDLVHKLHASGDVILEEGLVRWQLRGKHDL